MVDYANVKLWGRTIGVVFWDVPRQTANFEYTSKFAQSGLQVSPLRMPLEAGRVYSFPELNFETYKGLPGMLADSLPDHFGNALINSWLARQGCDPDS